MGRVRDVRRRLGRRLRRSSASSPAVSLEQRIRALEDEVDALRRDRGRADRAMELADEIDARLRRWTPTVFSAGLFLAHGSALCSREMGPGPFRALEAQLVELTGAAPVVVRHRLQAAYRSLVDLESAGCGRVAGSTANVLGKLVASPLLAPPSGVTLEIGSLYGLFAGALGRELRRVGMDVHVTAVDPFEGVQVQPGSMPSGDVTGTPVTEAIALRNLQSAGFGDGQVRLVRGRSTDDAVRQIVGDRSYGLIVVDGDHSEDGVAADLAWCHDLVQPGTVVVVDDYGDPRWSGVKVAVDRYLDHGSPRLRMLGEVATSAFLVADRS